MRLYVLCFALLRLLTILIVLYRIMKLKRQYLTTLNAGISGCLGDFAELGCCNYTLTEL